MAWARLIALPLSCWPLASTVGWPWTGSHIVGQMATMSADPGSFVTDSAAAATAIATGVKTLNGSVSIDLNGHERTTILELARDSGRSVGLVSTCQITDATPAAFAAHVPHRADQSEVARQYVERTRRRRDSRRRRGPLVSVRFAVTGQPRGRPAMSWNRVRWRSRRIGVSAPIRVRHRCRRIGCKPRSPSAGTRGAAARALCRPGVLRADRGGVRRHLRSTRLSR